MSGTPSTDDIRDSFRFGHNGVGPREFDEWLVGYSAQVAAEAIRGVAEYCERGRKFATSDKIDATLLTFFIRDWAERVESGARNVA